MATASEDLIASDEIAENVNKSPMSQCEDFIDSNMSEPAVSPGEDFIDSDKGRSEPTLSSDEERSEPTLSSDEDFNDSDETEKSEETTVEISEDLRCPLCQEVFTSPRRLPCFHSFCQDCLQSHIHKTISLQHFVKQIYCPICGNVACSGEISKGKLVHVFPLDTFLLSILIKSGEQSTFRCNVCEAESDYSYAEDFCIVCEEALCDQCSKAHRSPRLTATHTILKIEDLPSKQEAVLQNNAMFHCKEHSSFPIEYYCNSHETQLCARCFIVSHKNCPDVTDLTNDTPNLSNTLNRMEEHMQELTNQLKTFTEAYESNLMKFKSEVKDYVRAVNQFMEILTETVIDALKNLIKRVEDDGKTVLKEEKKRIKQLNHSYQSQVIAIRNSNAVVGLASEYATQAQMFLLTKKIINQLSMTKRHIDDKYSKTDIFTLQLDVDPQLLSVMKLTQGEMCRLRMKRNGEVLVATDGFKPIEDLYIKLKNEVGQMNTNKMEVAITNLCAGRTVPVETV